MVEAEEELDFLDLFLQVFLANELRAIKQGSHSFGLAQTLALHYLEEFRQLLLRFAENVWVSHHKCPQSVHLEALLSHKELLKSPYSVGVARGVVQQNELGVVAHHKVNLLLEKAELVDKLLLCWYDVVVEVKLSEGKREPVYFEAGVPLFQLLGNL